MTVRRGRARIVVVQVLVVALFATLCARLWYVQVVGGDEYQARAANNANRQVLVQPQRGLVVDAMGRPLAANEVTWVVTVDRSRLTRLESEEQSDVLGRLARLVDLDYDVLLDRIKLCGEQGAPEPPACWNGSPYEPVPVAQDVPRDVALSLSERAEEFPAVAAEQRSVRAYPRPEGVNAAQLLGYVTPITADEYDAARERDDESLNAASVVGRAGVERSYDADLRGVPGTTGKSVDSRGRVIAEGTAVDPQAGRTLVTSIDSRVQALAEGQLKKAIEKARTTHDDVTGRSYEATAGAAVVLDPDDGRVIAAASYPSYDPQVWVDGITNRQLESLYAEDSGTPLLSRVTQAQLAPGSTWKPFVAAGALEDRWDTGSRLDCSSGLQVGNRWFKNYESASYGPIGFDRALAASCDTFFYRIAYAAWTDQGGTDAKTGVHDPLVEMARAFGFSERTGIDIPGEAGGRLGDRQWRQDYWKANKDRYCAIARKPEKVKSAYLRLFAREFCADGYVYRAGDAVNFSIGQGETLVTPLQLAVGYAALANGGTLYEPRVAKAVLDADGSVVREIAPERAGRVPVSKKHLRYIDGALLDTAKTGTMAWKMGGFPLDQVKVRSKTGTAEVTGRQTTGWVASYDENYVVVMMMEQAGTGSGSSGDAVRAIWEGLYGIEGGKVRRDRALMPRARPPVSLPRVADDGRILPPVTKRTKADADEEDDR
ncbi:penicillin-binding protein 2 [Mumia sp. zg.B17]|uniref:penicillin-binding protein 2 n=1 Tax=Mumia sp. zg.B17 TaxID=2855446 RepID=UPI001C6E551B|nr:penicillin-binding protein 2 [Mumia sp. zg.B17]MBW9206530.1 penicillin-binding protein 2 [Mumia sp. zg.B17]